MFFLRFCMALFFWAGFFRANPEKSGLNIHVIDQESEEHLDEILGEISELKQSTTNTGKLVYYLR